MKKQFGSRACAALLCAVVLCLSLTLIACNRKTNAKPLKLGLGVDVAVKASDATSDKNGQGQATVTVAAVLVDDAGKIVRAFVDCADSTVDYTAEGKAVAKEAFATKYEQGEAYGMTTYGGAKQEWYKQADAFCTLITGKTADEVKTLVAEGGKGTPAVIDAGCTIYVSEFVRAVEKAVANATASDATEKDTVKLGVATTQTTKDATEDAAGQNKIESTVFAAAVNADGKITAAVSDSVEVTFTFDGAGKSTFDTTKAVATKSEQGDAYGMVAYGGAKQEWYKQADAFDSACVGKTTSEIAALAGSNGMGNADLQAAGCTIRVDNFVKAASKISK